MSFDPEDLFLAMMVVIAFGFLSVSLTLEAIFAPDVGAGVAPSAAFAGLLLASAYLVIVSLLGLGKNEETVATDGGERR